MLSPKSGPLGHDASATELSEYRLSTSADAIGMPAGAELDLRSPATSRGQARFPRGQRDSVYRRSLGVADLLAALGALLASMAVDPTGHPDPAILALAPLILTMDKFIGAQARDGSLVGKPTLDEGPALFQLATLYALVVWLIDGLVISGEHARRELLALWVVMFLLLLVFRPLARWLSKRLTPPERCLLIGDAVTSDWLRLKFARRPSLHAAVVGWIAPSDLGSAPDEGALGLRIEDVNDLVSRLDVDRIVITSEIADGESVIHLVHAATSSGLKVSVLPRVLEVVGSSVEFDEVEGVPLLSMHSVGLSRSSRVAKRGMDVIGSSFALLVLGPLMALIAIAVKLGSPGPVLFRQRRVGRDGAQFQMLKFRTMVPGADRQKPELCHLNEASGLFKIARDPRVTRVGRALRRMSFDELPQLVNVLRGEMSLVGPRPLIVEEDRRIEGWHRRRLHLTPGMTGHWQTLGSARIPLDDMVRIDYLYVTNWSLWMDVKILLRTIPYVLAQKGL